MESPVDPERGIYSHLANDGAITAQQAQHEHATPLGARDCDRRPEPDLSDSHNDAKTRDSVPNIASGQPQTAMDSATAAPGATPSAQYADAHMGAAAALLLDAAYTSSHESAGTGLLQSPQEQYARAQGQYGQQGFVPRKDANDNIPTFVQTSALFTNMCGYCGTRSTSGCWRRGWEIGPNKFINLCNKCGLRHKAGKLASVPEPPPPQLRGRTAAAAAAAAAAAPSNTLLGSYGGGLQHSTSAADLVNHLGQGGGSPGMSGGHEAAASDPTAAGAQAGGGGASCSGRRRRSQKPLTPKWSRVGAPAGDFQQDAHMLAQLMAAGAFGGAGGHGMEMYGSATGSVAADHQQQQQLAALLQSIVDGGAQQGAYDQQCAPGPDVSNTAGGLPSHPLQHNHSNSSLSLSHYNTTAQHPGAAAAAAAASASPAAAAAASPGGHMDAAQAVAAVLAAAAAAASSDHNAAQQQPPSPGYLKFKLGKLSVGSGTSTQAGRDGSQMSSPAAKKRRTKKDAAAGGAEDEQAGLLLVGGADAATGRAGGGAGQAAQRAEDAAAAGVAADALLALRSSAKPESPSWGRLQHTTAPSASLPPRVGPAVESLTLPGNIASRQVTSPSIGTSGGGASKSSPLAPFWQSLPTMQHTSAPPGGLGQVSTLHAGTATPSPYLTASHLQPLQPTNVYYNWSQEQVQAWLQHCGCGEAAAAFKAQGIDGPALSGLVRIVLDAGASRLDDRLKEDLGLQQTAARLRLVDRMMAELTATPAAGGYRPLL